MDKPVLQEQLKRIHDDGFNIYMMLNKLKKDLHLKENFPDELVSMFCEAYWKQKPSNRYPYFLKTFQMISHQYQANLRQREHKKIKNTKIPESVKSILKLILD